MLNLIKNIIVVLLTIFVIPLIFFYAEVHNLIWLEIFCLIALFPTIIWWGKTGYNKVFTKKIGKEKNQ